jgi:predicted metal-dependent hydrolase
MALFWGWHAAEETEHKAVCFDLYVAAGGGWLRRAIMFLVVSLAFYFLFFMRAYLYLLRTDRHPRPQKRSSTVSLKQARFALRGPVGFAFGAVVHYLRPSFHPWQRDNRALMEAWLRENEGRLRVIRPSARKRALATA